ncbi:WD40/YVTN/BNR-like repeat-containing protein [Parvibium lacunae]|uniref:DUF6242 domain-containing protein n=1 Tax=Parvibium lacunae TaxID=1888893 RepID=A0A368L6N6_9BURK|nr:hypothetical protein [Parvibium lacunae]RCS59222.1 hypothetical protein DU000_00210 [Parvibium lacunae]
MICAPRLLHRLLLGALTVSLLGLSACRKESAPSDAPTGVTLTAQEGQLTVSWTQESGFDYTIFYAPGTSVSTSATDPSTRLIFNPSSPRVITGLTNGQVYAVIMNKSRNGSPGGPATPVATATPSIAGASWLAGAAITGSPNLVGLAYGAGKFVAVGNVGLVYSSTYGRDFTAVSGLVWRDASAVSVTAPTALTALYFDGTSFITAGADNHIYSSTDTVTWTRRTTAALAQPITGINRYGSVYVAVGNSNTIRTSTDLITWNTPATVPALGSNLLSVTTLNSYIIATGAGGVVLTSTDPANTWTQRATGLATEDIHAVTYNATAARYVAVGKSGRVLTATDPTATWTASVITGTPNLFAVSTGTRVFAVGQSGTTVTTTDNTGNTWATAVAAGSNNLNAVAFATGRAVAVGNAGASYASPN